MSPDDTDRDAVAIDLLSDTAATEFAETLFRRSAGEDLAHYAPADLERLAAAALGHVARSIRNARLDPQWQEITVRGWVSVGQKRVSLGQGSAGLPRAWF